MASSPIPSPQAEPERRALPDYMPARMINEFVYCPRLFYYEQVEGLFAHSSDTIEGAAQHKRVDKEGKDLPPAEELEEEELRTRALMLASDGHHVIAKMDLLEVDDGAVTPVDYKHGRPRETDQGIELWSTDRIQLAVQGLILRDNGYRSDEGIVFYQKTRQRVRVKFTDELMTETLETISRAWRRPRPIRFLRRSWTRPNVRAARSSASACPRKHTVCGASVPNRRCRSSPCSTRRATTG